MIFQSCNTTKNVPNTTTSVFWVSGEKTECTGVVKMQCLQVYRGENLNNASWKNFYSSIEGFKFEVGYLQKIEVKEEKLDPKNIPADGSSIKYTLVKVLEKQKDYQSLLNGNWTLQLLNNEPVRSKKLPTLNIDLLKKRVSGTDGCNNYNGKIINAVAAKFELGNIASTKKMCQDMSIANVFNETLRSSSTYQMKGNNLIIYNKASKKALSFTKNKKTEAGLGSQSEPNPILHNIWIAIRVNGEPINKVKTAPLPRMEINLAEMTLLGNNSCNGYYAELEKVTKDQIEFGHLAIEKKLCQDMAIPKKFDRALRNSKKYKIKGLNLMFLDKTGKETILFAKGD